MRRKVQEAMDRSYAAMRDLVWPRVRIMQWFGADMQTRPVEKTDEHIARHLDYTTGIDWLLSAKRQTHPVASRVQFDPLRLGVHVNLYYTFTVRVGRSSGERIEYQKYLEAEESGGMRPFWSLQAYVREGALNGVFMVKTLDILQWARQCPEKVLARTIENRHDGERHTAEWFWVEYFALPEGFHWAWYHGDMRTQEWKTRMEEKQRHRYPALVVPAQYCYILHITEESEAACPRPHPPARPLTLGTEGAPHDLP